MLSCAPLSFKNGVEGFQFDSWVCLNEFVNSTTLNIMQANQSPLLQTTREAVTACPDGALSGVVSYCARKVTPPDLVGRNIIRGVGNRIEVSIRLSSSSSSNSSAL